MDSVLISHFLTEQRFDQQIVQNEMLLFIVGTSFGIFINLPLRKREDEFDRLSRPVDDEIKSIIHRMAVCLKREDRTEYCSDCFARLDDAIQRAKECALRNWNNTILYQSSYELDYIKMRENQSRVLMNIYKSITMINMLPAQIVQVADFFSKIEVQYHRNNDVKELLDTLEKTFLDMKGESLPESREEFEARAVLFYTLKQLDEFLVLKNQFVERHREKK